MSGAPSMHSRFPPTVVNVGYRSTNYYVVSAGARRLLIDLGWPGTFGALLANLKRAGVPLTELRYGVATHYHIDHAGLAQELKLAGVPLLVVSGQEYAIPLLKQWTKPGDHFIDITLHDNVVIAAEPKPAGEYRHRRRNPPHTGALRRQCIAFARHRLRVYRRPAGSNDGDQGERRGGLPELAGAPRTRCDHRVPGAWSATRSAISGKWLTHHARTLARRDGTAIP